jgi:cytochrome c oxidase cbb3-type subunit 3
MKDQQSPKHDELDPLTRKKYVPHHEFDGIRELENKPPYWLSIIFVISVLFSYFYFAKYHIFKAGDLQEEKYRKEMAQYLPEEEVAEGSLMAQMPKREVVEIVLLTDDESLSSGEDIFETNCVVCHLSKGQGLVGPNLTDDYWIHGGSLEDIVRTITDGVPAKGMISWKTQISSRQILEVASYITTLRGTNPPDPKAPEGELYEPPE